MSDGPTLLLVAPFPPTKGPEADKAYYLCRELAAHGWNVHVATTQGSVACDHPRATVHPVVRDWSYDDAGLLVSLVERHRPDVIVLLYIDWLFHYHPMVTFFPTLARAVRPDARIVTVFDDVSVTIPWEQPFEVRLGRQRLKRWATLPDVDDRYGTLLRDSDRIVVVSGRVGARLAPYAPGMDGRLTLVPTPPILPIAPEEGDARTRWRQLLGLKPKDFLLAYFGYISQSKGVETLLRAFALVCAERKDVRLVLIGGTIQEAEHLQYAKEVHRLPSLLGIEDRVYWTGEYAWDSDEASRFLRASDLCVLPYDAGVCIHNCSFAGAAAHGLPIVTTRGPDLEEQFVDRENVLLCEPENPEALAAAMREVLGNAKLRQRLRACVLDLAREWFTWDSAIRRMGLALPGNTG